MRQLSSFAQKLGRPFWALLGVLSLGIGAVGVVLPVLPTTPFVILAAFAFARSAPSVARWIERNRVFGPILADWRRNGAIAPRYKRISIAMMAMAFLGAWIAGAPLYALGIQILCILGAATFILTRPNGPNSGLQPSGSKESTRDDNTPQDPEGIDITAAPASDQSM